MKRFALAGLVLTLGLTGCGAPLLLAPTAASTTQAQSLFGWWGENGKARALKKFSDEEGRKIAYVKNPEGVRMEAHLSKTEADLLGSLLALGTKGATSLSKRDLPDGLHRKGIRHLKLFRRQKETKDSSLNVTFQKLTNAGQVMAFGVTSKHGYQAFYTTKGRLLVAFVIKKAPQTTDPTPPPEDNEPDE